MINKDFKFSSYTKLAKPEFKNDISFDWCVFLDEEREILNNIEYIKYILHPTFPNPERIVYDYKDKFALYSNGWGSFNIRIEIVSKNKVIYKTNYYLNLKENNWPIKTIDECNLDPLQRQVYSVISDSNYNWRKKSTIVSKINLPIANIDSYINQLEELNLIRKANYKSIDNQELFGVTSKIGIKPE
jgi:transcription initiation factor IIF auxiliary subunit